MSSNSDASSKQGRNTWVIVPNPFIVPDPPPNPLDSPEPIGRKPTTPPSKPPLAR